MKYFSLLIVTGVLMFAACKNGNNTPKTAKELLEQAAPNMNVGTGKFSIDLPAGWRKTDTTLNGIKVYLMLAPDAVNGYRPTVNVISEKMGNHTLDLYFDMTVKTMGRYTEKFAEQERGDKDINGIPAKWLKYTTQQAGMNLTGLLYVIPKNGIAYAVTGMTTVGQEAKDLPVFTNTIASFKVTE
jgi:hypothetical protein